MKAIAVTDDKGNLLEPIYLEKTETVHRQLRPQLPPDYANRLQEVFDNGGRMVVVVEGNDIVSVALWRIIENTYEAAAERTVVVSFAQYFCQPKLLINGRGNL